MAAALHAIAPPAPKGAIVDVLVPRPAAVPRQLAPHEVAYAEARWLAKHLDYLIEQSQRELGLLPETMRPVRLRRAS